MISGPFYLEIGEVPVWYKHSGNTLYDATPYVQALEDVVAQTKLILYQDRWDELDEALEWLEEVKSHEPVHPLQA
jgi:hypothetical protein